MLWTNSNIGAVAEHRTRLEKIVKTKNCESQTLSLPTLFMGANLPFETIDKFCFPNYVCCPGLYFSLKKNEYHIPHLRYSIHHNLSHQSRQFLEGRQLCNNFRKMRCGTRTAITHHPWWLQHLYIAGFLALHLEEILECKCTILYSIRKIKKYICI